MTNQEGEKKETDCTIRVWDFGGQDIYHATHRYFMQSRALILLVWDAETEGEEFTPSEQDATVKFQNFKLPHWIDYIGTLSKQSPVIVVQNKRDRDGRQSVANRGYLEQLYPNIVEYESVSSKTGRGFEDLKEVIREAYEKMPELGMAMPRSWYNVRQAIFDQMEVLERKKTANEAVDESERYLTFDAFSDLCERCEVSFNSNGSLLRYLHNTGGCFIRRVCLTIESLLTRLGRFRRCIVYLIGSESRVILIC